MDPCQICIQSARERRPSAVRAIAAKAWVARGNEPKREHHCCDIRLDVPTRLILRSRAAFPPNAAISGPSLEWEMRIHGQSADASKGGSFVFALASGDVGDGAGFGVSRAASGSRARASCHRRSASDRASMPCCNHQVSSLPLSWRARWWRLQSGTTHSSLTFRPSARN